jgi:hypothetical protein
MHKVGRTCKTRHAVSIDGKYRLTDRCNSGLLWSTVARAVCQGKVVVIEGHTMVWDPSEALAYLKRNASVNWYRDLEGKK